jgi:hypothetical protein
MGTTNKKVAIERATQLAADLARGTHRTPPPPVTVRQAVEDYLTHLRTADRARKTIVKYRGVLGPFVSFLDRLTVSRLGQETPSHFDRWRAARRAEWRRKTVYNEGVIVKQLFKWARMRKLIAEDPLADIRLDKPPLEPKEGPAFEQVNRLVAAPPPGSVPNSPSWRSPECGPAGSNSSDRRPSTSTAGGSTSGRFPGRKRRRGSRARSRCTLG